MVIIKSADALQETSFINANLPSQNTEFANNINQFSNALNNTDLGASNDNLTPLLKNIGDSLGIDLFNMKESDMNQILSGNGVDFDINAFKNSVQKDPNFSLTQLANIVTTIDSLDLDKLREQAGVSKEQAVASIPRTSSNSSTNQLLGIVSMIQLLDKSDVNKDGKIDEAEMQNLVITLNYALESAKIKKELEAVKARNKVFSQSSGLI